MGKIDLEELGGKLTNYVTYFIGNFFKFFSMNKSKQSLVTIIIFWKFPLNIFYQSNSQTILNSLPIVVFHSWSSS